MKAEEAYCASIDARVRGALKAGVPIAALLDTLPGADPLAVRDALVRLGLSAPSVTRAPPPSTANPRLPTPHPLDFDWRFCARTSAMLLDEARARMGPQERVFLLGVPSLLVAAEHHPLDGHVHLLDRNPALPRYLGGDRFTGCDVLNDPLPRSAARVVVADPPWYPDLLRAFAWAAHALLVEGGTLLLCFPSDDARPDIASEREAFFRWTDALGFTLREYRPAALTYDTPPFERNAHRAAALKAVPPTWRRGDLAVLVRHGAHALSRPQADWPEASWHEHILDGIRWRIRPGRGLPFAIPTLTTLVDDDILPTVSRRDPRRASADVWTSGNRIFACTQGDELATVLLALSLGEDPLPRLQAQAGRGLDAHELPPLGALVQRIQNVVSLERAEYGDEWHAPDPSLDPQGARRAP